MTIKTYEYNANGCGIRMLHTRAGDVYHIVKSIDSDGIAVLFCNKEICVTDAAVIALSLMELYRGYLCNEVCLQCRHTEGAP